MSLSTRELSLGWITMVTILLGATYYFGQPMTQEWKNSLRARDALDQRQRDAERLLRGRSGIDERLAELRKQLPQYPQGQDVTAEQMRTLDRTAQQNNLVLLRREPEKERNIGDLYELSINCTWEGDLDAVVRFLYALQTQGAILDVRQLTMSPGQGGAGRLKGNFTVDCAYARVSATPAEP